MDVSWNLKWRLKSSLRYIVLTVQSSISYKMKKRGKCSKLRVKMNNVCRYIYSPKIWRVCVEYGVTVLNRWSTDAGLDWSWRSLKQVWLLWLWFCFPLSTFKASMIFVRVFKSSSHFSNASSNFRLLSGGGESGSRWLLLDCSAAGKEGEEEEEDDFVTIFCCFFPNFDPQIAAAWIHLEWILS